MQRLSFSSHLTSKSLAYPAGRTLEVHPETPTTSHHRHGYLEDPKGYRSLDYDGGLLVSVSVSALVSPWLVL